MIGYRFFRRAVGTRFEINNVIVAIHGFFQTVNAASQLHAFGNGDFSLYLHTHLFEYVPVSLDPHFGAIQNSTTRVETMGSQPDWGCEDLLVGIHNLQPGHIRINV